MTWISHLENHKVGLVVTRSCLQKNTMMLKRYLSEMQRHVKHSTPYVVTREIRWALEKHLGRSARRRNKVVSLRPIGPCRGHVLLSYILEPFLLKPGEAMPHTHTNYWESWQIAQTFLDLGYAVDVIHFSNNTFLPRKQYSVFIDVRWNLQRLAPLLPHDCIKIMHIDHGHVLYMNAAEARRLLALQQRKGITLRPRRFEMPNLAIENADCATILGDEFTKSTFAYARKFVYRIPISSPFLYPFPEDKDFESSRKRFLWFGGTGFVHKGLDLVLDAFAEMPEYHLKVCGPIEEERDFQQAYYKELYETPNIHTFGWVDVESAQFLALTRECIALVYPSASEGGGGSVISCLHAGLIPIVSYESSVDVHDFGVILKDCSINEIQSTVRSISERPVQELERRAKIAWEFSRTNHTREKFAEEYKRVITRIITMRSPNNASSQRTCLTSNDP